MLTNIHIFFANNFFAMSNFTCKDEFHEGSRVLPIHEKGHGTKCKTCKARITRERTAVKTKEKKESKIGRFASCKDWSDFNAQLRHQNPKARFVPPVASEFTSESAFIEAHNLYKQRTIDGADTRQSQAEINEKKRKQYSDDVYKTKNVEEYDVYDVERSQKRIDDRLLRNKVTKEKKQTACNSDGLMWCTFGSHAVRAQDICFCPQNDLGILDFHGQLGDIKRPACKDHYLRWMQCNRNSKKK